MCLLDDVCDCVEEKFHKFDWKNQTMRCTLHIVQ